jgi:hypothetical protein
MTIEEFESLPDELALNHELVDGKLVDLGGNILAHHRLRDQLVLLTGFYVEQESLGVMISEQDFDFNGDVYGPDLSFIGIDKLLRYRRSGTREVWVFSIENRVAFLLNENQRVILDENQQFRSDLIPGFSIRIGDLLDRL